MEPLRLRVDELVLRPPCEADVPALVAACQDPEIVRFTRVPSPYTEEHARQYLDGAREGLERETHHALVVADAETDELLGTILLVFQGHGTGEIGYWTAAGARGRGIATRATRALAEWGLRERSLARVQLHAFPDNAASQRVAEKAGFTREGIVRSHSQIRGMRRDLVAFSLLAEEPA
jgi:RimJ/RimL family protein N-acetyltransferase